MEKPTKTKYKGYKIWQDTKSKIHSNRLSGHSWNEEIPIDQYYISGLGVSILRKFGSVKRCKEHIDYLISNNLNMDYTQLKGL